MSLLFSDLFAPVNGTASPTLLLQQLAKQTDGNKCDCNTMLDLLDQGADLSARDIYQGATPIHYLAQKLSVNCLSLILAKHHGQYNGSLLNFRDNFGQTALFRPFWQRYLCTAWKHVGDDTYATLKVLLQYDADINIPDDYGDTPLHLACRKNIVDLVDLFIRYGGDVNPQERGLKSLVVSTLEVEPELNSCE